MPLTASRSKRIRRDTSHLQEIENQGLSVSAEAEQSPRAYEGRTESARSDGSHSRTMDLEYTERRPASTATVPVRLPLGTTIQRPPSVRREGPTAMSYILHSTPTLPISYLREYDQNHSINMHMPFPDSGDGYIQVTSPPLPPSSTDPPPHVMEAFHSPSWNEVVNRLVETYLSHVSPLLPIVVREDIETAEQHLIHAVATVAATRRNCPKEIFDCLKYILKQEMLGLDVFSDTTRQNAQVLLVTCMVDELALESGAAAPVSVQRARLAAAIRMCQDLSMDRVDPLSLTARADKRIWQCALVIDQLNATRTGSRPIVASSTFKSEINSISSEENNQFFEQLFTLCAILSRILDKVYGPDGVKRTKDEELIDIRDDLKKWKDSLPPASKFSGAWSSLPAGLLHLLYTLLLLLLYRPFMRWSFICPAHISLSLDMPVWLELNPASRQALEWATNQDDLADLLFFGPYALGLMCLVQYHSYARRREWDGVVMLEKFRKDAVERWTSRAASGHMLLQAAQLDVIDLFYAATQTTLRTGTTSYDTPTSPRGLNPTPGVLNRLPETSIHGVTFLRDPTHPQGGVLVATQQAAREVKDLPAGTVIIGSGSLARETLSGDGNGNASNGASPSSNAAVGVVGQGAMFGDFGGAEGFVGPLMEGLGEAGRVSMSTPDWEAIVSSFTYPPIAH
ncbi:hypothetical protein, variant [Cryptococcus amylolentus CBS 6039]|nr:hypothetical protein, variant [Cryptococcus amylolentus CBS 6039]ODN73332.1 hypothetical protein, variant [Cryptococcus amylolentus CBS 6039]ODN99125.1 hypothetical protein I350_07280 [Cryptococcus amylolentus CBS 6273]